MRVGFQGEHGAYSEEAVVKHFGGSVESIPRPLLRDVFESVKELEVDQGLIPVENTIEGSVGQSWDLLLEYPFSVRGEVILRIIHSLIANPGVSLGDVRRVYSHPQALGQCRAFLERHGFEAVASPDTAGSVRMIRDRGLMDAGAIASSRAAEIYEMSVLARGIETHPENYTRFLIVGRGGLPPSGGDKTSVAFSVERGSLVRALRAFEDRGLDIVRLDSRPSLGRPWEYVFFADVLGHVNGSVGDAVRELEGCSLFVRVLGSYPRAL